MPPLNFTRASGSEPSPKMAELMAKARQIIDLGNGMSKADFFGALAIAAGQSLKYLMAGDDFEEALDWYLRNVKMIATTRDHDA